MEHVAVVQRLVHQLGTPAVGHGELAVPVDLRINPQAGGLSLHLHGVGLGPLHHLRVLGRGEVAQVGQAHHPHQKGARQQPEQLRPGPARLRRGRGEGRLRGGLQRTDLPAPAQPQTGQPDHHGARQVGQAHHRDHHPGGVAGEELVLGAVGGQNQRQIQQGGHAQHRRACQQLAVCPAGHCRQQQRQRRNQVPLVHPVAQTEDGRTVKARQQHGAEPAAAHTHPGQIQHGGGGDQDAHGAQHLPGDGRAEYAIGLHGPVAAQQGNQVKAVHAGIGIAGHGAGVLFHQPVHGLIAPEGQREGQHHRHGQNRSQCRAAHYPAPLGRRTGEQGQRKADGQHRPEQQSLGLQRQRQTVKQCRRQIFFLTQQPEHSHQTEGGYAVHLLPDGGVVQKGRAEGDERRDQHGPLFVQMSAGNVPDQSGEAHIAQDGHAAQQQHKALSAHIHPQQLAQAAQHPEHQHIAGGIIRKVIRGIELPRPQVCQALSPGGEAGHVGGIALGDQGQPDAQHSGTDQQHQQAGWQPPGVPAGIWFGVCHDLSPLHTHGAPRGDGLFKS